MSELSLEEKLAKLGEVYALLDGHHLHQQAEIVQRVHEALSSGGEIPIQDVHDLQTVTRYGLLQARSALAQIQQSIIEAEEIASLVDIIYTDAIVQQTQREIDVLVGEARSA